jgi:replicative DNA helicase
MSTSTTQDLLREIYPLIQQSADRLLPDFGFRRITNGWEASQGAIGGSPAKGHLYYYTNTPFCLVDNKTGDKISVWDYVATTCGLTENRDVLRKLAEMAGYTLPDLVQSPAAAQRDQDLRQAGEVRETYLRMTQASLSQPEGAQTLAYLHGRGYTDADIRAMGLGFNPGWEKSLGFLTGKGFSREAIEGGLRWLKSRDAHKVVIPQKDPGGRLVGLWGRVIDGEPTAGGKYMTLSDGSAIGKYPSGIETCVGQTTGICVEGLFDARLPAARGLVGVVGWGRTSPTGAQLATLAGIRVKNLILIPDNDDEGRKGLERTIKAAVGYGFNVYVVELPSDCKDLDQFVVKHGVESFRELASDPMSGHRWMGKRILEKHDLDADRGEREALDEIVAYEGTITDPLGRRQFREQISAALRLSEEQLERMFREHREIIRERETRLRLSQLGRDLIQASDERPISEIRGDIEKSLSAITVAEVTEPAPFNPEEAIAAIQLLPENLPTGYPSLDAHAPLWVPSLVVVAARVAHAKTTFTFNLFRKALEQEENAGKPFVIVSLEVPPPRLLCQFIGAETGMGWLDVMREIKNQMMSQAVMDALEKYRGYAEDKRLYVVSDRGLGVDEVCAIATQIQKEHGQMGAVAIDYLGLLANHEEGENVEQKYSSVMNRLTTLSHELVCPVIVIAQINREADKNRRSQESRMPRADQLRYSGQIESDADVVWGLFNVTHDRQIDQNAIVNPDETPVQASYVQPADAQIVLLSLKDRYGPGFRPINFRLTNGVRIEEWNSPDPGTEGRERQDEEVPVDQGVVVETEDLPGLSDDCPSAS